MRGAIVGQDLTGRRFAHLTSLGRSIRADIHGSHVFELVRCECGTTKEVDIYSLLKGATKSCGCKKGALVAKSHTTHGHGHGTPTYRTWVSALGRCTNPNNNRWHRYGGRGIRVCDRWLDFSNFLADMGERPAPGYEIDRIDNDGDYTPKNCRWAPRRVNLNNTSQCRPITAFGITKTVAQWSRHSGINTETIRGRLNRGWSTEDSVSKGATMMNDLCAIRQALSTVDLNDDLSMRTALAKIGAIINGRLSDLPLGQAAMQKAGLGASLKPGETLTIGKTVIKHSDTQ